MHAKSKDQEVFEYICELPLRRPVGTGAVTGTASAEAGMSDTFPKDAFASKETRRPRVGPSRDSAREAGTRV